MADMGTGVRDCLVKSQSSNKTIRIGTEIHSNLYRISIIAVDHCGSRRRGPDREAVTYLLEIDRGRPCSCENNLLNVRRKQKTRSRGVHSVGSVKKSYERVVP